MTEPQRPPTRDEGAMQTARIMAAVRKLQDAKGWSDRRLAQEMTDVGVPWKPDIVVNLKHGRRKSLRVHELLALCFVLGAETPLDVLVPLGRGLESMYPVTPGTLLDAATVRRWFLGETGPLRDVPEPDDLARVLQEMPEHARQELVRQALALGTKPVVTAQPAGGGDDGEG